MFTPFTFYFYSYTWLYKIYCFMFKQWFKHLHNYNGWEGVMCILMYSNISWNLISIDNFSRVYLSVSCWMSYWWLTNILNQMAIMVSIFIFFDDLSIKICLKQSHRRKNGVVSSNSLAPQQQRNSRRAKRSWALCFMYLFKLSTNQSLSSLLNDVWVNSML